MSPPFIDCHCLMPYRPHESDFFARLKQIPYLGPLLFVVSRDITLPFMRRAIASWDPIDNKVSIGLSGIVKKTTSIYPPPTIRVSAKSGCFTIEENDFFLFAFLFQAFGSMNKFHLVEKTNHVLGQVFPFPKALGMGANRKALHWEGHRKVMQLHARGRKLGHALQGQGRVLPSVNVQSNPLSKVGGVRVYVR